MTTGEIKLVSSPNVRLKREEYELGDAIAFFEKAGNEILKSEVVKHVWTSTLKKQDTETFEPNELVTFESLHNLFFTNMSAEIQGIELRIRVSNLYLDESDFWTDLYGNVRERVQKKINMTDTDNKVFSRICEALGPYLIAKMKFMAYAHAIRVQELTYSILLGEPKGFRINPMFPSEVNNVDVTMLPKGSRLDVKNESVVFIPVDPNNDTVRSIQENSITSPPPLNLGEDWSTAEFKVAIRIGFGNLEGCVWKNGEFRFHYYTDLKLFSIPEFENALTKVVHIIQTCVRDVVLIDRNEDIGIVFHEEGFEISFHNAVEEAQIKTLKRDMSSNTSFRQAH